MGVDEQMTEVWGGGIRRKEKHVKNVRTWPQGGGGGRACNTRVPCLHASAFYAILCVYMF